MSSSEKNEDKLSWDAFYNRHHPPGQYYKSDLDPAPKRDNEIQQEELKREIEQFNKDLKNRIAEQVQELGNVSNSKFEAPLYNSYSSTKYSGLNGTAIEKWWYTRNDNNVVTRSSDSVGKYGVWVNDKEPEYNPDKPFGSRIQEVPLEEEKSTKDRYLSFDEILDICNIPNVKEHKVEEILKRSVFNSECLSEICIAKEPSPEDSQFRNFLQYLADIVNEEMQQKDEINDIDQSIKDSYDKIYNDSNLEKFLKKNDVLNNKYFKFLLAVDDKIILSPSQYETYKTSINKIRDYLISLVGRKNKKFKIRQDKITNIVTTFGIELGDDNITFLTSNYLIVLHYIDNDKDLNSFDPSKSDANFVCKYGFLRTLVKDAYNLEILLVNNKLQYKMFNPPSSFITQSVVKFKELIKTVKKELKNTKVIRENDDTIIED